VFWHAAARSRRKILSARDVAFLTFVVMSFQPDSSVVADLRCSPNHGDRRDGMAPDMIVLHYTGMADADAALDRLCSAESEVSAHYLVHEDGRIIQCVPEARRAWHAGAAAWAGETDVNSCSIGIEIVNPGHDYGYPDFPSRQVAAVIALCRGIVARRGIRPDRVLGHSDVAPARKQDPGEKFPWPLLAKSGVGLWVKPARITKVSPRLAAGDAGEDVTRLQAQLSDYGYGVEATGSYDDATRAVVAAFQRHFRPARIDGIADPSTRETLTALLAARDAKSAQP
jgi:N-acetylmuramoyl-L-alanine amidase